MRALLLMLKVLVVAAAVSGCTEPSPITAAVPSHPPAVFIRQYPDYPPAGRSSVFPGGLVIAIWRDGYVIRRSEPDSVGKAYVGGMADRQTVADLLGNLTARQAAAFEGIPIHSASQTITIRRPEGVTEVERILPDPTSQWSKIEGQLLCLALTDVRPVDSQLVMSSRWHQ